MSTDDIFALRVRAFTECWRRRALFAVGKSETSAAFVVHALFPLQVSAARFCLVTNRRSVLSAAVMQCCYLHTWRALW